MDLVDTHITCKVCNGKFSNILLHLKRSPSCDEEYPLAAKQKLIKFCDAEKKRKKTLRNKKSNRKRNEAFRVIIMIIKKFLNKAYH